MNISISEGWNKINMDDSGITLTWQQFIPWEKVCSIADALEALGRGNITSTVKLDENNTLALVADSTSRKYVAVISKEGGATEARYVYLGSQSYKVLYETVDALQSFDKKYIEVLEALK